MKNFHTADLIDISPETSSCTTDFKSYGLRKRFYGKIRTVRCCADNVLIKQLVNTPVKGEVLVIDGQGARSCALMGDMLANSAMQNGWAGVIIFGMIRDSVAINEMDFGIKALGTNPRKSAKTGAGDVDISVSFGDVVFIPQHFIYSDEDGILVSEKPLI